MSTTVTYKGNTLTTVNNATKTLKTAGKYMEDDIALTDATVDLSSDTVTPETLMQGYTAHNANGILIVGEAMGGDEGSAYQDEDGYIVLGEGESSAPQGNLSITTNGIYDVTQYAGASVEVPAPAPELQSKTATPTESQQTVSPDSGYDGLSSVTVEAISNTYVGSGVARRTSTDLTASGATVTVPAGYYAANGSATIESGELETGRWISSMQTDKQVLTFYRSIVKDGYLEAQSVGGSIQLTKEAKTVTPTESSQQVSPTGSYYRLDSVTVDAIPSTYVGSGISRRDSSDISEDSGVFTIPAGYYNEDAACWLDNAVISYDGHTISNTGTVNMQLRTTTTGYAEGVYSGSFTLPTQGAATITPTESQQTAASANHWLTGDITVKAIPSTYVGSGITQRTSSDLTTSGATVIVPSGYYSVNASKSVNSGSLNYSGWTETETETRFTMTINKSFTAGYLSSAPDISRTFTNVIDTTITPSTSQQTINRPNGNTFIKQVVVEAMPSGTAGTPTATKGTVSDHSISIIPSVTNTTGYITGGTKTGTAINVSASELVSDTLSITENGTADVTNYASVDVNVNEGPTYTATIVGNGSASYPNCFVSLNNSSGTKYYTDGTTFTFSYDDDLYFTANGKRDGGQIILNGVTVAGSAVNTDAASYTYKTPRCNLTIQFKYGVRGVIEITVPEISITANGQYDVSEYVKANVEVSATGMSETDLKAYIERTSAFTDINWPDGITRIGPYAFAQCTTFNPSSLPSSITMIQAYAFCGCSSLSLTSLPSGVTSIGTYAFYDCNQIALTSLPSGVTSIGGYAFYDCNQLALTSLPSGVTSIGSYAFSRCYGLSSISCEGSITSLSSGAFTGNASFPMQLVTASFPNMALTSNISNVFGNTTAANACQLLKFCDIGSTAGIAANAFANCYALQMLVLRKTASICTLANVNAFLNTPMSGYNNKTGKVYVPSALIESYKTATNWKTLYDAGTVEFLAIEGSEYER